MGFLGSIGSFLGGAVNTVVKTVTQPAKLATAIVTGGASVVAPKVFRPVESAIGSTLYNPALVGPALSIVTPGAAAVGAIPNIGAKPMALNIGNILGQVGGILGGSQLGVLRDVGSLATLGSSFIPQATAAARPPMPTTPGTAGAMRTLPMVGRRFFEKFPNLASAIQSLRNRGANVTRSKLWSLLKRFGPDILISGGILTAAAVSELMMAGPGTRRMNPGNAKALRRSLRRLESFHKLCVRADKFRGGTRRRAPCRSGSGQQFVRQG